MQKLKNLFSLSLSFKNLVTRRDYIFVGIFFTIIKYLGDLALMWIFSHEFLSPWQYLNPLSAQRWAQIGHNGVPWLQLLWSIPFIWLGFSLTIRRAIDAGLHPWWSFFFFIPIFNWLMIYLLCFLPSRQKQPWVEEKAEKARFDFKEGSLAAFLSALICAVTIAIFVYFFEVYSGAMFIGLPFVFGFAMTTILNLRHRTSFSHVVILILVTLLFVSGILLLFAMEGFICIAMAAPPFLILSITGAAIADLLCRHWSPRKPSSLQLYSFFLFPLLMQPVNNASEVIQSYELHEVISSIEINAPVEQVWPHVIQFSELPPPKEWMFRLGVAHPLRAVIEGNGVGAIRRCQFSTGDFVEPITEWNEPNRLSFDVQFQPRPMKELSPYETVYAPHLDGFIRSQKGQFRLVSLPGNRTRIEGSTWYEMNIHPTPYWGLFADYFIHQIHLRVLNHIRGEVEG